MHGKPPPGGPFDISFQFALRALEITAALPHRWSNFVSVESDIREITEIRNILSAMIGRIDEAA